jgi:Xaa-Pro dipeptidase
MRLTEIRYLERYAPGCRLIPADDVVGRLRMRKDTEELSRMRRAAEVAEAALEETFAQLQVGMSELEVAGLLTVEILQAGAEGVPFQPIVISGPNAASPHAVPSDRPIRPGETIVIDCGATVGGYASDITRTIAIEGLPEEMQRVYEVVKEANAAGRAKAAPGVPAQDVDQAARAAIEAAGYGDYFVHRTGHGLGLEGHELPYIVKGNQERLQPGMTFTIEPGIYLPRQGGVRIEDDVVITPEGVQSLTTFPRELTIL